MKLCEQGMLHDKYYEVGELFMWMLHNKNIMGWRIVYVNVTWKKHNNEALWVRELNVIHDKNVLKLCELENCLSECYTIKMY
jgi:hypothetical protein